MDDAKHVAWEGRFLRMALRGRWEFVERVTRNNAVGIVALTDARELVLVEQYRPPVAARVIEPPAGIVGDIAEQADESAEAAARRELIEETGYEARSLRRLTEGLSSPGLTNESLILFLATGLRKVGAGGGDSQEQIVVHAVPVGEVETWLEARRQAGCLIDVKVYAALYFAAQPAQS